MLNHKNLPGYILILIISTTILFFPFVIRGQNISQDSIHFVGRVYDAGTLSAISEVHVLGSKSNTISSVEGNFSLWACKGDSLRFSHVSYKSITWRVSDTIDNPDMLIGIFLSRDTIAIDEVIIYPRLRNLESLMTEPLPQDKDIRNAKNNLNILGYQARNTREATWDAEANSKYALQQSQIKTEYAGLIPPDEMVPVTAVIPFAIALIRQKYANENKEALKINYQEDDLLKSKFIQRTGTDDRENQQTN